LDFNYYMAQTARRAGMSLRNSAMKAEANRLVSQGGRELLNKSVNLGVGGQTADDVECSQHRFIELE
jgi:hypothetical protein